MQEAQADEEDLKPIGGRHGDTLIVNGVPFRVNIRKGVGCKFTALVPRKATVEIIPFDKRKKLRKILPSQ